MVPVQIQKEKTMIKQIFLKLILLAWAIQRVETIFFLFYNKAIKKGREDHTVNYEISVIHS